ncbi:beta-ketoacyl-ACP synthase [Shewanella frigidimarina]|jgi:3-oxoacyl-[acyl-carrier-protein] synthase II|uniref:Beta-ketoacyl synthase n=2 Tax=Shewanella TaxID=22 RepID=Q088W5_SHEFN|nr:MULTISPECIES: beta-ketoacyl-ACP synthase [Shewanella]ABI70200.1 beta-ketoacyl synthase [Shewanella frigidimarina NCIMB 400]MBB1426100.1 beta-ketoacyl-ACP synthase [Shewanella sp. SG44-2]RPA32006.1 beta-ketoacyl-ACP synthase [Shewanella frigidimarina]HBF48255.1 beta-ketoacyl-ACP synthase [Shewanella frigidimarina]|tara:strand:+ start:4987 stop:6213 length:1227 start_codon:yes stop_codon:yes gene_type:complete
MKRVVVTGMGGISALGQDWQQIKASLLAKHNCVIRMDEWDRYPGLNTRLAAPVTDFTLPAHYSRKKIRSMGRVSMMATRASELALEDAGLLNDPILNSGQAGVAYGSSTGSTDPIMGFGDMLKTGEMSGLTATSYIRMMAHTTAVNIGVFFGLQGRIHTTSSACTSASQGIGYAYEAIKYGMQTIMLAGGGEELCPTEAVVFDTLYATSTKNDTPELTPRPFDKNRDGLVIGEGACTLILEELEHAQARGANIYAELVGFGTNSDGQHVTQPNANTMEVAIRLALKDAQLSAQDIGYISAHGTATDRGDIAETAATHAVFGAETPISSLKSYTGHTLGACGSLEAWSSINMMNEGWFAPTLNLNDVDPECAPLDYIKDDIRHIDTDYIMSNNFAFGGINTSLIFKRWR